MLRRALHRRAIGRPIAFCAAMLTLAGTAGAAAAPTMPTTRRAAVPWRSAGPGWSVVEYSTAALPSAPKRPGKSTFYLVSPAGRKYAFYVTSHAAAYPKLNLVDWSGDRQRILVERDSSTANGLIATVKQISLAAGQVISSFRMANDVFPFGYTRPRGTSALGIGLGARSGIFRYSLTGHLQRVLARGADLRGALAAPDGKFVVTGTATGLEQISNSDVVMRRIRMPASAEFCGPDRWWNATTVLADCFGRAPFSTSRLWLVPIGGGKPIALTPALRPHGLFQGYVNAWRLPTGLYLQADNAHDTLSIVRQYRDGSEHTVTVPGPARLSDWIVTTLAGRLLLESNVGPGGPSSLFWFAPATRTIHFVFRTPPTVRGVDEAIPYGYESG